MYNYRLWVQLLSIYTLCEENLVRTYCAVLLLNFRFHQLNIGMVQFHVLPRELFGLNISTFEVSMKLLKVFPLWFVDKCLVYCSWLTLGGTAKYNLIRPEEGPLAMKARTGQTPVLDVGTVAKIRSGDIQVTYNLL
jgi:hypothetical protein